ncbi:tail fiber domain-containing protein [Hymenobacter sp. BT594]|uniref:Tail fiber domain-containing protein n=2 Tax=Hymenobacter guriensis TaxID=2793065 RepID=A0ABS0L6P3_9BACT|nr:tail fiber domain-containing protein [Hymenobacter guriensis]
MLSTTRLFRCLLLVTGALLPLATQAQSGSVGIGTTTPDASAALEVRSTTQGLLLPRLSLVQRDALGTGSVAAPVAGLVIYQTDNTPGLYAYDGAGWVRLGADNLGNHIATQNLNLGPNQLVGNDGSQGLRISASGDVGFGPGTPRGHLDVNGGGDAYLVDDPANGTEQSVYLPGQLLLAPYSGTSGTAYVQASVPTPNTDTNIALQFRTSNSGNLVDALLLNANGSGIFKGSVTATSLNLTSDARFKTQVRPLSGALAHVQLLRGVRYRWNALGVQHGGQPGDEQVGLLAQELEAVYPELVRTDEQGYKSVNYVQLTPVLLEAIKELKAENDTLKGQVTIYKAQTTLALERLAERLRVVEAGSEQAQR